MTEKLFKEQINLKDFEHYSEYIENTVKPIGFGEKGDEVYELTKMYLFLSLYNLVKDNGPSFDAEIYFTSLISEFNDTFDKIGPTLLQLQRDKESESHE